MKIVSDDYIAKEEASERKPVDIYKIWRADESQYWYYTSGDAPITYSGVEYTPATLERSDVSYDQKLDITSMTIKASYLATPLLEYIEQNPVKSIWVFINRVFIDQSPTEASSVFMGQIKDVSFKGVEAKITCVGFEYFLNMAIPSWRYQLTCNLKLYDDKCKVVKDNYKINTSGTLDSSKTTLTSTDFGLKDNGYFTGGTVEFENATRTIIAHSGNTITMVYKIVDLEDYDTVDVYPGCDKRLETCGDNYDNYINFMGTPFIPVDDPATDTIYD